MRRWVASTVRCASVRRLSSAAAAVRGGGGPAVVGVAREGDIATLTLDAPPVNTLTPRVLDELLGSLTQLEADPSVRGLVVCSARPNIFSAGLDLGTLATASAEEIEVYWGQVQELYLALHGSRLATAAVIEGHAPAAGCILALLCDARFMAPGFTIGLNEAHFKLPPPGWVCDLMASVVGARHAERAVTEGLLLPADRALALGLVDRVDAAPRALALDALATDLKVDAGARNAVRNHFRGQALQTFRANRRADAVAFACLVRAEPARTAITQYFADLKASKTEK